MKSSRWNDYLVNLVENLEDLEVVKSRVNPAVMVGIDTETTGLDFNKCVVTGYCVSVGKTFGFDDYQGYYIPVRHNAPYESSNLPLDKVVEFIQYLMDNCKTMFFNRNFDFHMMEKDGIVITPTQKWHDSQMMKWESDQIERPGLKDSAKKLLKRRDGSPFEVLEYSSNKADEGSFATVDPQIGYIYAAGDPLLTVLLGRTVWMKHPEIHKIYTNVDNPFLEAIRYFNENAKIYLDYKIVDRLCEEYDQILEDKKNEIYKLAGFEFKLTSPKEKSEALRKIGVKLTAKTPSGAYDTSKEVLSKIDHPICKLLTEYNGLQHTVSTYLSRFKEFETERPDGFTVAYQPCAVPTGRLATGADKKNPFFAPINMQGIAKQEIFKYVHEDDLLGYRVDMNPEGAIGKMKVKGGIRDAFIAPEGYVFLNADFAAEELRVIANLSREPNFVNPIKNGEDIHTYVAKNMFGFEDKSHRTKVKVLNFAMAYGASPSTIASKLDLPLEEAKELYDNYFKTMKVFKNWMEETVRKARMEGLVQTCFGRPRSLARWFNSPDRGDRGYAERAAVNSPIQGFGGDLIRICHIKLWKYFLEDKEFAENCLYHSTVHDEISLLVKPHYLKKAYEILKSIMFFHPEGFEVPIIAEPAVGYSWGTLVEATGVDDNNHLILNTEKMDPLTK